MKKKKIILILTAALLAAPFRSSEAALPTFDAWNFAMNRLRNTIMNSHFRARYDLAFKAYNLAAETGRIALQTRDQLELLYRQFRDFNFGSDNFQRLLVPDLRDSLLYGTQLVSRNGFGDFWWMMRDAEIVANAYWPSDIRAGLERITGKIPNSAARPYIPFDESQVVEGFRMAKRIRDVGQLTRDRANSASARAEFASPNAAARLQVELLSKIMILGQQNQEAVAKLIELEAVQIEQVSRDEKRLERQRLKYMRDAASYLEGVLR